MTLLLFSIWSAYKETRVWPASNLLVIVVLVVAIAVGGMTGVGGLWWDSRIVQVIFI
jgi:hypothetical protein